MASPVCLQGNPVQPRLDACEVRLGRSSSAGKRMLLSKCEMYRSELISGKGNFIFSTSGPGGIDPKYSRPS